MIKHTLLCAASLSLFACSAGEEGGGQDAARDKPAEVSVEGAGAGPAAAVPAADAAAQDAGEKDSGEQQADSGALETAIPARFRGTYSEDMNGCAQRSHGNFTINARQIDFFESRGEVQNVRVNGDYAAATVREAYADDVSTYAFYMALEGGEKLRFRYDKNERQTWVRCP